MVKAGEALFPDTFTVNERVLLHLRENGPGRDDAYPLTQPGIASTLGIRVNHVSRAVKQLVAQRLVAEGTTRVRGEVRKRKVYVVTSEGHALAVRLASAVSDRRVVVADGGVERTLPAAEAKRLLSPPTLTRLLAAVDPAGRVDLRPTTGPPAKEAPRVEEGRPSRVAVLGREAEIAAVRAWLSAGPPLLTVLGERGIGKSALLSAAVDGDRPSFWWAIREGDDVESLLGSLATFLAELGKHDLRQRIAKGSPDWRELAKLVGRDLRNTGAVLVFDDVHVAGRGLAAYVDATAEAAARAGCRVALTSERPATRRTAYIADGLLAELTLGGLSRAGARALVPAGLPDAEFEKMYRLTKGNPLALKILASEQAPSGYSAEERALLKVLRMRQEAP